MGIKSLKFVILFAFVSIFSRALPQENLQESPGFVIGTFTASSSDYSFTNYQNYWQVQELGVNSIFQRAVKNVPELNQPSNFDSLMLFPYIYAANDSGTGTGQSYVDAQWQNIDWISYFTSAKYRKWEAEGDLLFTGNVKVRQEKGEFYTDPDGTEGYRTNNQTQVGDTIIKGPKYYQYPRYTYTQPEWNPLIIRYKADFRLKIDSPSENTVPVCSLYVTTTYYDTVTSQWKEDILDSTLLTTNNLTTSYQDYPLFYNYSAYINTDNLPPGETPMFKPYSVYNTEGLSFNIGAKVQFKVQWLGNKQLSIDRIEVYDAGQQGIWDNYFSDQVAFHRMVDSIENYNQHFTELGPKLKYYYTMDEPHSIDSYEPLRVVQHILDSLNIGADLLTHFYPEWDGYRDDDPTFPQYCKLAQPKKLLFWYAPYTIDNTVDPPLPDNRDFTLWNFRINLQNAYLQQPGFYLAAQTFGYRKNDGTNDWNIWMSPTPEEIKTETMLSLAHGCKGIYYEGYYSYCSTCADRIEGLVDFNYEPRPTWDTVKVLTNRLNGALGKTLMSLNYDASYENDGFLRLYPFETTVNLHEVLTQPIVTDKYLTLFVIVGEYSPVNFHAGFFKKENDNNYFLLTNLTTTMDRWVGIKVYQPKMYGNYVNYRFRNIEPQYNLDSTFTDSLMIRMQFPAGEGYLFQVSPVIKYGGKLYANETISNNNILYEDMTIENGVTLTVNSTYDCYGNIHLKGSAHIVTVNGGTITFHNDKGIIAEGNPQIVGTSSHQLRIDFGFETSGSGIQLF